jgi:hypothetical protein
MRQIEKKINPKMMNSKKTKFSMPPVFRALFLTGFSDFPDSECTIRNKRLNQNSSRIVPPDYSVFNGKYSIIA